MDWLWQGVIVVVAGAGAVALAKVLFHRIPQTQGKISATEIKSIEVEPCKEDRMDKLRSKCQSVAWRLSKLTDIDIREIHGRFKPQKEMTETELQGKLDQLVRECNKR